MVGRNCSALVLSFGIVLLLSSCGDGLGPNQGLGGLFSVADGDDHVCLLQQRGSVHCWGWGGFGQLGAGDTLNYRAPTKVQGGQEFASIASGSAHTCGLVQNGTAFCWGFGFILFFRRGSGDAGDERDANAALRRDRKLLRGQCLAIDNGRRLHQRPGDQAIELRAPLCVGLPGARLVADLERHRLPGDVVAHPLTHDAHRDSAIR